ncbi:MAG: serine/threonine protein kinase, partial [Rivularia sp. (in: cyanobacteria)]
ANSQHSNLLSQQPQLCRVVAPTELTKLPELRHQPYREVEGFKELNQAEKVLYLKTQGDFVQIKLADGTQGWIFWDQLQPCD